MNICWYAVSLILCSGGIGGISGGIGGNGGEGGEQGGNGGAGQGPTFIGKICFPESVTIGLDLALNVLQFGSWAHALAAGQPYADWSVTMALPPATNFQYKFIKVSSSGSVTWEWGPNRVYTTPTSAGSTVTVVGVFGSTRTSRTSPVTAAATGDSSVSTITTTTPTPQSTGVSVTFSEFATTSSGEVIKLVGSISELGSWSPKSAITLSSNNL
ncbi:hypothetical protein B0H14DRAFT_1101155 [Mycena olivaceomarginata]|nr:hypothetical protein B0H14DRAFT_1101155 [Mycena olivaceomarginata]